MSDAVEPLRCVRVLDPRVNLKKERVMGVVYGPSENSFIPYLTQSYSDSNFSFTSNPPGPNYVIDRQMVLKYTLTLSFQVTGKAGGQGTSTVLTDGYDGLRQFPFSSVCSSMACTINNTTVSSNLQDYIHPLLRYNDPAEQRLSNYSGCPTMPDCYADYGQGFGSLRNPLGKYDNSPSGDVDITRASFGGRVILNEIITGVGTFYAQVQYDIYEPILMSPWLFGREYSGLYGVQNMTWNMTISNALGRLWCHSDYGNTADAAKYTFKQISNATLSAAKAGTLDNAVFTEPTLLFNALTLKELDSVPEKITYPYQDIQRYPTTINTSIAANTSTTINSSNIQLNSIPSKIYIYARQPNSVLFGSYAPYFSDTFLEIQKLTINFSNRSGLLSSASQFDLYRMSANNGINYNFTDFRGLPTVGWGGVPNPSLPPAIPVGNRCTVGGVICLAMGVDIGLSDLAAPGVGGTYQLQITAQVKNNTTGQFPDSSGADSQSIAPTMYIVCVFDGTLTITGANSAIAQLAVITQQDVLMSKDSPQYDIAALRAVNGGSSFASSLSDGISNLPNSIWQGVKKAAPYAKDAFDVAKVVAPLLMGVGEDGSPIYRSKGGTVLGGSPLGGTVLGGKKMSKRELERRLR